MSVQGRGTQAQTEPAETALPAACQGQVVGHAQRPQIISHIQGVTHSKRDVIESS